MPDLRQAQLDRHRQFNLMFKTFQGVTENAKNELYLRPRPHRASRKLPRISSATTRKKIPFGVGQGGQVLPQRDYLGNFTFRTHEFEQMELEFFCKPGTDLEWFKYWKDYSTTSCYRLGMKDENPGLRTTIRRSCPTTPTLPPISSLCLASLGELWALLTAPISTPTPASEHLGFLYGILRSGSKMRSIFRMLSSLRLC